MRQLEWEVRFSKLLIYQHAALRALGVWTVAPAGPENKVADNDIDRLLGDSEDWL